MKGTYCRRWTITLVSSLALLIGAGVYTTVNFSPARLVFDVTPKATASSDERRIPPSFNQTGVILFHHLAKTGGTTIRNNFKALDNIQFARVMNREQFADLSSEIEAILVGNLTKILFIEMHGGERNSVLPGLVELHPKMLKWRSLARANNVPLFAFTLLREPISLHVSAFLYFHLKRCGAPWCSTNRFTPREDYIVASAAPNRQCAHLARGQRHEDAWRKSSNVTADECQTVIDLLRQDFDWVGTTETLTETTLPMLFEMLNRKQLAREAKSSNINRSRVSVKLKAYNLTHVTRQALEDISMLDMKLYAAFCDQA